MSKASIAKTSAVVAVLVVAFAFIAWESGKADSSVSAVPPNAVTFQADAGTKNENILNVGGLVIRASCTDFGQGRKYLSVSAKTTVNNAARALVLSQRRAGQASAYSFKSSDFDRSFGYYDITGTNPYDTTGTFSYARPDGGQVAITFRADEDEQGYDCYFAGDVRYIP